MALYGPESNMYCFEIIYGITVYKEDDLVIYAINISGKTSVKHALIIIQSLEELYYNLAPLLAH